MAPEPAFSLDLNEARDKVKKVSMHMLANRVRQARRYAKLSQAELARRLGVQRSAISQWERPGGSRPITRNLELLAVIAEVSFEWLATGRGTMLNGAIEDEPPPGAALAVFAQNRLEVRLISAYRRVRRPLGRRMVELIEALADLR